MAARSETLAIASSGRVYEVVSQPAETKTKKVHTDVFSAATDLARRSGRFDVLTGIAVSSATADMLITAESIRELNAPGFIAAIIGTIVSVYSVGRFAGKRNGLERRIDELKRPEKLPKMSESPHRGGMNN